MSSKSITEPESTETPSPASINVSRADRVFAITWSNGHVTRFSLDDLRLRCECATCREEREKRAREQSVAGGRSLPVLGAVSRAEITSVQHVGRYAVGVGWKDGHQSIYGYRYLYASCQCETCRNRASHTEGQ